MSVSVRMEPSAQPNTLAVLRRRIAVVKPHLVSMGIHPVEGSAVKRDYDYSATDETVVGAMTKHEFGLGVPERSFLREYFDSHKMQLLTGMRLAMSAMFAGNAGALMEWAKDTRADWVEWIELGAGFTPLSPATLSSRSRAGIFGDEPLVATRQFLEAFNAYLDGAKVAS